MFICSAATTHPILHPFFNNLFECLNTIDIDNINYEPAPRKYSQTELEAFQAAYEKQCEEQVCRFYGVDDIALLDNKNTLEYTRFYDATDNGVKKICRGEGEVIHYL